MGQVRADFSSSDLRDPMGNDASYDSSSLYYGAHLGLGYLWNLNDSASIDLYAKYFWAHQGCDTVTVAGDSVHFDDADSHRLRAGHGSPTP